MLTIQRTGCNSRRSFRSRIPSGDISWSSHWNVTNSGECAGHGPSPTLVNSLFLPPSLWSYFRPVKFTPMKTFTKQTIPVQRFLYLEVRWETYSNAHGSVLCRNLQLTIFSGHRTSIGVSNHLFNEVESRTNLLPPGGDTHVLLSKGMPLLEKDQHEMLGYNLGNPKYFPHRVARRKKLQLYTRPWILVTSPGPGLLLIECHSEMMENHQSLMAQGRWTYSRDYPSMYM